MNRTRLLIWVLLVTLGFSSCIVVTPGARRYGYGGGGYHLRHHHNYHGHHNHGCR